MSAMEIIALATSFSLLSGWRLYFTLLVTGLAMRFNLIALPDQLQTLNVMANPWVIGIAGTGFVAEFLADKVAWLDSAWDAVHSFIRPVGGALIALAIVDPGDPVWQIITFLLGGGGALLSHGVKAGTRAMVNTSPEPFSNAVVSASEDVATAGVAILTLANPVVAAVLAIALLIGAIIAFLALRRVAKRVSGAIRDALQNHQPLDAAAIAAPGGALSPEPQRSD